MKHSTHRRTRGFTLAAVAVSLLVIMGTVGLGIDLGRMFYNKSEIQAFCDAAAINAALKLDGTSAGIDAAKAAVSATATGPNAIKWEMGTKTISIFTTTFAKGQPANPNTPDAATWSANPGDATDYRFVQVYATVNSQLTFMIALRAIIGHDASTTSAVNASAIGGQVMIVDYPVGLLPFSPIAPLPITPDNFGLIPAMQYTMRYPSNGAQNDGTVCTGDQGATYWTNLPSQDRGYWGSNSAAALRGEVVDSTQARPIVIGEAVPMVGGAKNTEGDALATRVAEDSDSFSATYAAYVAQGTGNGRRVIGAPINSGPVIVAPYTDSFIAVGIGAFFLLPASSYNGITGSNPICAEYIGPYVQGKIGAGGGQSNNSGSTGGYVVRLVS